MYERLDVRAAADRRRRGARAAERGPRLLGAAGPPHSAGLPELPHKDRFATASDVLAARGEWLVSGGKLIDESTSSFSLATALLEQE